MKTIHTPEIEDVCEPEDIRIRNERGIGEWKNRPSIKPGEYIDNHLSTGPGHFSLGCGKFLTRGVWVMKYFATISDQSALRGRGPDWTSLNLDKPVMAADGEDRPDVAIINIGSDYANGSGCVVEDLSIYAYYHRTGSALVTSGVRGCGHDIRVSRVRISGIRGSVKPYGPLAIPYEAFGISFGKGSGGHVVSCCRVEGEVGSYFSAYSANSDGIYPTVFERCDAKCADGYAALTVYDNAVFRDCMADTFAYGVYNDTEDIRLGARVEGCRLDVSRVGVGIVAVEGAGKIKRGLRVRDTVFTCLSEDKWVGLELIDKTKDKIAEFCDIEFVGCKFRGAERLTLLSTDASRNNVRGVRFIDCQFRGDTVIRASGNEVEIIRPRNLDGMLIEKQIPSVL